MCVVIDTNTLASVFNEKCSKHAEFRPVLEWIQSGRGLLVYGGTRYKEELAKAFHYLKLVRQMRDAGQAVAICDKAVDTRETEVRRKTNGSQCDDQHMIALLGASRCTLFCSDDARADPYVKDRTLYPARMPRVRIYRSHQSNHLLRPMSKKMLTNLA